MMEILRNIWAAIRQVIEFIRPPRAFAWQTSIWLSIFSWVMSVLSEAVWLEDMLSNLAWLFLVAGVNWALLENPIKVLGVSLGPWLTGALICLFVFDRPTPLSWQVAVISWPLISAAIAAVPKFLTRELRLQIPTAAGRQSLILLILVNSLISCWLQFYFRMQYWLEAYPSFLADDFSRSAFVVYLGEDDLPSRGIPLLETLETTIKTQVDNQPWSAAERWLFGLDRNLPDLETQVKTQVPLLDEANFWDFKIEPSASGSDYKLTLQVEWHGPHAGPDSYLYEKICQVRQTSPQVGTNFSQATQVTPQELSSTPLTAIECGTIEKRTLPPPVEPVT